MSTLIKAGYAMPSPDDPFAFLRHYLTGNGNQSLADYAATAQSSPANTITLELEFARAKWTAVVKNCGQDIQIIELQPANLRLLDREHYDITEIVVPRAAAVYDDIPLESYEGMWRVKYGDAWVMDNGFGPLCIESPYYLAAATALFKAGKMERHWVMGTDKYAYRLLNADR